MTDKQIALLVSVLSMFFLVLSVSSLVMAISVRTELTDVNAQLSKQSAEIQQLTANQITLASMMAGTYQPPVSEKDKDAEVQVLPDQAADTPVNEAATAPPTESSPAVDLPPQRVPVSVDLTRSRQTGKPQANAAPESETILAAVQPPVTTPKAQTSIYQAAERGPEAEPKKTNKIENVDELLVQRIVAKWKRPPSARNGMSVEIVIKMNRKGDIRSVEVARSSGDKAFDDSATAAIKAVKSMPEVAKIKDESYQSLYKERRVAFSPENLSS